MEKEVKHFLMIIVIVILLGVFVFNYFSIGFFKSAEYFLNECAVDSDCVISETRCCPCSSSGKDVCVSLEEGEMYAEELKDCSKNLLCAEVFSCVVESCGCVNGRCVG
ncbi:hypothetical protein HOE04_01440 [archaeon]|nr:hypothetical protein [archaeon]